jgi:hypothetical protein
MMKNKKINTPENILKSRVAPTNGIFGMTANTNPKTNTVKPLTHLQIKVGDNKSVKK